MKRSPSPSCPTRSLVFRVAGSVLFAAVLSGCDGAGTVPTLVVPVYRSGDGVPADSAAIIGWGSQVIDYSPGTEALEYTDPSEALGRASGVSTDVVSLGRGGSITVRLDVAVGATLPAGATQAAQAAQIAVFENGIPAGSAALCAELAYVEISADGVRFVRFPVECLRTTPVTEFGTIDPSEYRGFAGLHPAGTGTVFDPGTLANTVEVLSGAVDISAIRYVRIVDVVGDGSQTDSLGRPVYDPYPTSRTAGFDLDGVAVLGSSP